MKPEIQGAIDACEACKDQEKPVCYTLKTMKELGHYYRGYCGRDTENGILFTRGDVNEKTIHGEH